MKPENSALTVRRWLGLLALGTLSACGGGGGVGGGIADGGIRGTGSSVGPVSGFGSVFVNGVEFDTSSLGGNVVSDDGIDCERADQCNNPLQKGMILRVDGEWKNDGQGSADKLEYDDTFRGHVESVTPPSPTDGTGSFTILGQTINFDRQTVFKLGAGAEVVTAGQFVRVSGWRAANGEYRASFVGLVDETANTPKLEFEGEVGAGGVTNHGGLKSFTIGDVTVEFDDDNTVFEGVTEEELGQAGTLIEVEGDLVSADKFFAVEIAPSDNRRYRRDSDEDIEFTGPISSQVTGRRFTINGLTVEVNDETEFEGLSELDLKQGLLVQVEGEFLSDGDTVLAEEIELREANSKVEGTVDPGSIDPDAMTLSVGGVLVKVAAATVITEDDDDGSLAFGDLTSGMEIEVSGIERKNDSDEFVFLEALKIEREEREEDDHDGGEMQPKFEMEGRLESSDPSSSEKTIKVLGVTLIVDANSSFGDDADDIKFDQLQAGDFLEVEYILLSDGRYFAEEVEREEDDDDDD